MTLAIIATAAGIWSGLAVIVALFLGAVIRLADRRDRCHGMNAVPARSGGAR